MINAINPVAIDLFGLQIMWYAIFIMMGIVGAVFVGIREGERLGLNKDDLYDGILYCVPLAILGARLYYVIFTWEQGWDLLRIIGFEDGQFIGLRGLAINGGIITAGIFVFFYCKKRKFSLLRTLDLVAPGLLIGQLLGRWGNFFNQEAFGPVTTFEFLNSFLPKFIVDQMFMDDGSYHHPTFLYESLWNTLGLIIILFIRRSKWLKTGDLFPMYLVWYGFFRGVIIEPLRQDPLMILGFRVNVVMNICLALLGLTLLYLKRQDWFCKTLKIENKYYHEALEENNKDGKHSFI